jgi:hypothetical protein
MPSDERLDERPRRFECLNEALAQQSRSASAASASSTPTVAPAKWSDLVHAALEKAGAAEAAGISTLAVLTGGSSKDELHEAGAAEVVRSIAELRDDRRARQALAS